ncbi:MAG: glycoside hydrolase family 28 protein [Prevotella sp.]|nr:glycoside hydrolase family 28 protein [Candidatus Prevotella equi]
MKKILSLVALFMAVLTIQAQDFAKYYADLPADLPKIKQVQPVFIPETTVKITDFGGVGDGKTLNTEAIEKAIKSLVEQGGGHLVFPEGTWKTGPITLKSKIDLHLDKGATILFSEDKSLYVKEGSSGCVPCIKGSKVMNVTITGEGTIDGQGIYWRPVKKVKVTAKEWKEVTDMGGIVRDENDAKKAIWYPFNLNNGIPNIAATPEEQETMRKNHLINITDAINVMVQGVTLLNSPKFHLVPTRVKNLIIDGVTVKCPPTAQNGDAFDIGNTQTCLVVNCDIDCGDDGICMKGGVGEAGVKAGPNSDFLIRHNTVHHAHGGFVIGSEFCGGMNNLIVYDCDFQGTEVGLRFKSAPGRGGWCKNIYCMNIRMNKIIKEAIIYETGYADKGAVVSATANDDKSAFFPDFGNMAIWDVTVDGAKTAFKIEGLPGLPVHDINLDNVQFKNCQYGLLFKNAKNILMNSTVIQAKEKNQIDAASCNGITYNGIPLAK